MNNTDEFHNNPEQKKKVTKNVNTISHSKSSLKGKILYGDSHLRGKNTKKYEKVITIIKTVDTSRVRKKYDQGKGASRMPEIFCISTWAVVRWSLH